MAIYAKKVCLKKYAMRTTTHSIQKQSHIKCLKLVLDHKNISEKNDYTSAQYLKRYVRMTANMN